MPDATNIAAPSERKFASRKFVLALLIILGAGAMSALGIKPDPTLAELVKWVAGLYFAGNVAADWVSRK